MNIYKYLENNVDKKRIMNFSGDIYELACIRYVLMQMSKLFYRDIIFFLNDEQIEERYLIYDKKLIPEDINSFNITCYSYCTLLNEILKKQYDIQTELVFTDSDVFKHVALLVITKTGGRYFIDPLMDLTQMKYGMRTNNFASRENNDNPYARNIPPNLSFLEKEVIEEIDRKIGYMNNGLYKDDLIIKLKYEKHDNARISMFLEEILEPQKGIVDLLIYVKYAVNLLINNAKVWDFFVDEDDLKNNNINSILNNLETRKRGIVIETKNECFLIGEETQKYIKLNKTEWKRIIKSNNIFVRKAEYIEMYKYLSSLELEPNILDHREFQRIFSKIEKKIINEAKNPKDYIQVVNGKKLVVNYNDIIEFSIENNLLVVFNKNRNEKMKIIYLDEGRKIKYDLENV